MLDTVVRYALLDLPKAATVWLVLIALAAVAVVGLLVRPGPKPADDTGHIREAARRRAQRAAEARDLRRYADEVAAAAEHAEANARRHRAEWLKAQAEAESAWAAFDAAEEAARRLAPAAALPTPRTPRTPAEYVDRERYLHRAVMRACWAGELSVLDLSDAMAQRNGWDPRLHPVEQEVAVRRLVRDRALAAHQVAARREREAWHALELSAAVAQSLRDEAFAAAERAREAAPLAELAPAPAEASERLQPRPHARRRKPRRVGLPLRPSPARS